MDVVYNQKLLDYYQFPRHKGTLAKPDINSGMHNPSCGDSVVFQATLAGQMLCSVAFQGAGCVISQATASLLCEQIAGKSMAEVKALTVEDIVQLIDMPLGPNRMKCALLGLQAMHQGIIRYEQEKSSSCSIE